MTATWQNGEPKTSTYADWDKETRPYYLKDLLFFFGPQVDGQFGIALGPIELPLWQPVYIKVNDQPDLKKNARAILDEGAKTSPQWPRLLYGVDAKITLDQIVDTNPDPVEPYCFIYLLEGVDVPQDLLEYFTIVQRGPAVPGVSIGDLLIAGKGEPVFPEVSSKLPEPAVVTAVIDTEIGVANERFLEVENGKPRSRIVRFWRQQRESIGGVPSLLIGREFTNDDLDVILDQANGDERKYYALLRSGRFGAPAFQPNFDRTNYKLIDPDDLDAIRTSQIDRVSQFAALGLGPTKDDEPSFSELANILATLQNGGDASKGQIGVRESGSPPYAADSGSRSIGFREGHGTWVADLVAGWPRAEAPADRPIVAVELPDYVAVDTNGARLELFVLMGVRRILHWVDNWATGASGVAVPVVINISLGNSAGQRNGRGFLEREIARLVDARNARGIETKVVIAAGNHYRERLSAFFDLAVDGRQTVDWVILPGDKSPSFLEIRVPNVSGLKITITTPEGARRVVPATDVSDLVANGVVVGRLYNNMEESLTGPKGRRLIMFALAATAPSDNPKQAAPSGTYRIEFQNATSKPVNDIRLEVQRDDSLNGWPSYGGQSYLDHPLSHVRDARTGVYDQPGHHSPVRRERTISAHATSPSGNVFVMGGAYRLHPKDVQQEPALYTGSGPTWGPRNAPDFAAVTEEGHATPGLLATGYFSGSTAIFSGTSGAAPQLTRALADLIAEGKGTGIQSIVKKLGPAPAFPKPHPQLGFGVLRKQAEPGRPERRRSVVL